MGSSNLSKALTIAIFEFNCAMRKLRYWLITFSLPLLLILLSQMLEFLTVSAFSARIPSVIANPAQASLGALFEGLAISTKKIPLGYVDDAGLIKSFPSSLNKSEFINYPSESEGLEALKAGKIGALYLVDREFPDKVGLRSKFDRHYTTRSNEFLHLLRFNLLNSNESLANNVKNLLDDNTRIVYRPPQNGESFSKWQRVIFTFLSLSWAVFLATGAVLMLVWVDTTFGKDKECLTLEALLTHVSAYHIVAGKFLALAITLAMRAVIALAVLYLVSKHAFSFPTWIVHSLWVMYWPNVMLGLVYAVLFYLSLLGMYLRSAANNAREVTPTSWLYRATLLVSVLCISASICTITPSSTISWILSIFPLTSPVAICVRSLYLRIPTMEIVLSLSILSLVCFFSLSQSKKFFKL